MWDVKRRNSLSALPFDLGSLLWMIIALVEIIIFVSLFLLYNFWVLPPISRKFRKAKWSRGVPAFIQDETGKVRLCISNKEYPEGVVHYKKKGWFMIAKRPYENLEEMPSKDRLELKKQFVKVKMQAEKLTQEEALEEWDKLDFSVGLTDEEKDSLKNAIEKLIHTPILEGFGKQVFFGSVDSVALSNLKIISEVTENVEVASIEKNPDKLSVFDKVKLIAHANLRNCRLLAPIMYSKTQLDALATGNRLEGMKMFGRDTVKIFVLVIAGVIVIASLGIVAYMLTSG